MKKLVFGCIFLILMILGGSYLYVNYDRKPKNYIPPKKFSLVLADLHIVGTVNKVINLKTVDQLDDNSLHIFNLHSISPQDFYDNLQYYMKNLEKFSKIYDEVISELEFQYSLESSNG